MIVVEAQRAGGKLSLSMQGHAGYSSNGNDIVCAAASMLCCTLAECWKAGRMGSGNALLEAVDTPENRAAFDVVLTGFWLLSKKFPENVSISGKTGEH